MPVAFRSVHLDDVPEYAVAGPPDIRWRPVRRYLGVGAFGTNAFAGDTGEMVIERHDEIGGDDGVEVDQEEMYVVVRGSARFTIAGETLEAAQGTVVFLPDPAAQREATALEDGTLILAVGAAVGVAFKTSAWEHREVAKYSVPTLAGD